MSVRVEGLGCYGCAVFGVLGSSFSEGGFGVVFHVRSCKVWGPGIQ